MKLHFFLLMLLLLMTQNKSWGLPRPPIYTMPNTNYLLIENTKNDSTYILNFKRFPQNRLAGANDWSSQKGLTQFKLAYVNADISIQIPKGFNLDMWETGPISYPYITQGCSTLTPNCTNDGKSPEHPQVVDEQGFYGLMNSSVQEASARISPSFLNYLKSLPVRTPLIREMNLCVTSESYDALQGQRCKDMSTGTWRISRTVNYKEAHLKLTPTTGSDVIMLDSVGNPIISPGSTNCKIYSLSAQEKDKGGVLCTIAHYKIEFASASDEIISVASMSLRSKLHNPELNVYDSVLFINNAGYVSPARPNGLSLEWLRRGQSISVFFTKKYLSEYIKKSSNIPLTDSIEFFIENLIEPGLGEYVLTPSSQIDIKPREYSVSILSSDGLTTPYRGGLIGKDILSFPYRIMESGPASADKLDVTLSQDSGTPFQGACTFYPTNQVNNSVAVPINTYLRFYIDKISQAKVKLPIGCNRVPVDIRKSGIRDSEPQVNWTDPNGSSGITRSYLLDLEFDLTDQQAQKTVTGDIWEGEVHQSGTLTIKGSWR
jgi:hypothetical protein